MDRRRFFNAKPLNESFQPAKNRYLLEDVFNELNRLYEDANQTDETTEDQPAAANKTESSGDAASVAELQKEVKDIEVPAANIKLTGKAEELYNSLIDILQKSNLQSAVDTLEIVSADPKLKLLLSHGFTNGSDEAETVDVTIAPSDVPVSKMVPTQKEIGTDGSLKNILTGKHPKGTVEFADYFTGGAVASMPGPFVYQDGESFYIVDGHRNSDRLLRLFRAMAISSRKKSSDTLTPMFGLAFFSSSMSSHLVMSSMMYRIGSRRRSSLLPFSTAVDRSISSSYGPSFT